MAKYYERLIEKSIERKLRSSGAVVIEGPKCCGKITTALRYGKSNIRLNSLRTVELAKMETAKVLYGEKPRVIDEWQTVPEIWNEIKSWIDENPSFGQFILTGRTTPADKSKILHSCAGRISTVKMRPMSLTESKNSNMTVSLTELFNDFNTNIYDENKESSLNKIAYYICRGG